MITSEDIVQQIKDALRDFGVYTYHDKGAHEVMDLNSITNELKQMSAEQIIAILEEVDKADVDSSRCIEGIVESLDSWEGEEAEKFFDSLFVEEWY